MPSVASGAWQLEGKDSMAVSSSDLARMLTGCPRTNYSAGCGTNGNCCSISCTRTHRGAAANPPTTDSQPLDTEAKWDEWADVIADTLQA